MRDPLDNRKIRKLLRSFPGSAIKVLYCNYYNGLLKIAHSFTRDEDVAKDILQDSMSLLWLNAGMLDYDHERSILHYLVRIVRNKSVSHYNQQQLLRKLRNELAGDSDRHEVSTECRIIQSETMQEILNAIERFPRRERQCLNLKLDEGLSNPEISERLGVGIKAVERSITSGRKRLRNELRIRLKRRY